MQTLNYIWEIIQIEQFTLALLKQSKQILVKQNRMNKLYRKIIISINLFQVLENTHI